MKKRLICVILAMSMLICMCNFVYVQGEENGDINISLPEFQDISTEPPPEITAVPESDNLEKNISGENEPTEISKPTEIPGQSETQEPVPTPKLINNDNEPENIFRSVNIKVTAPDGVIIPNADVSIGDQCSVSDSDGIAHFDSIQVGKHTLKLYAAGYRLKATTFVVPHDKNTIYEYNTYLIKDENELMTFDSISSEDAGYSDRLNMYAENIDYGEDGGFNISYSSAVDAGVDSGIPMIESNGYIYCFDSEGTFAYDISNDSWTAYPEIPTYRTHAGAAAIGDIIYVIGGFGPNGNGNEVEAFNTNTRTWSTKASMPQSGGYFNAHAVNGSIYIGGGVISGDPSGKYPSDSSGEVSLYKYSPEIDQWTTPVQKGTAPTLKGTVSTSANGRIYFTAGHGWYASINTNVVNIYDTISESWLKGETRPGNSNNMGIFGGIFTGLGNCLFYQGGTSYFGGDDDEYPQVSEDSPCLYDPYYDEWLDFKLKDGSYELKVPDYQSIASYGGAIYIPENDNDTFHLKKVSIFNSYINSPEMYRDHNVAIGSNHILKIENGKVYAKGKNNYGQLGNGSNIDSEDFVEVTAVWGNKRIAKVETRADTSYALTEDGILYGWGDNSSAQIGDNTLVNKNVPVEIMIGITDISAGIKHASAMRQKSSYNDYNIYLWGSNAEKQIDEMSSNDLYKTPHSVEIGEIVEAGSYQTYKYNLYDRNFYAWGKNDKGQLGGSMPNTFNSLNEYKNVKKIATGFNHTAMMCNDNQLYVFGDNTYGQLGRNLGETYSETPIRTGIYPENIFAGANSTAYVLSGEVYQAGQGFGENIDSFKKVGNTNNIREVSIGDKYAVGVDSSRTLWRWGSLTDDSSFELSSSKKYKNPLKSEYIYDFIDIDSQRTQIIGINSEGKVVAWGSGYYGDGTDKEVKHNGPHEIVLEEGVIPKAVERGKNFNLILDTDGNVWGFGSNTNKPMGGTAGKYKEPTEISGISDVKDISAGDGFSIFLKNDGTLWGMGQNECGQLAQGNNTDSKTPVQITGKNNFTKVSAGDGFVAAIAGNEVYTWGEGTDGQLGNGTDSSANTPQKLSINFDEPYEKFVDIKTSVNYCIALTNKGNVYSWGRNGSGQLGHGDKDNRNVPTKVSGLNDIKAVFAENLQSFAIKNDGTVYAWGHGSNYQLGLNKTGTQQSPAVVTSLTGKEITKIVCGSGYSIALSRYGYMYSFGSNTDGCMPVYSEEAQKYSSIEIEDMRWLRKYMSDNIGNNITENISLPTAGPNGSIITWTSSHEGYISSSGEVHRPDAYGKDTEVTLTAKIGQYEDSETARFDLTVMQDGTIKPSTNIPIRSIGMEYDQMYPETGSGITAPKIKEVSAKVIDEDNGVYQLFIKNDQFIVDDRSEKHFFFWNSREGTFLPIDGCDDYSTVYFTADESARSKKVKITVGLGDGLGYADMKTITIKGKAEESLQTINLDQNVMKMAIKNNLESDDYSSINDGVSLAIGLDTSYDVYDFDPSGMKEWFSNVEGLINSVSNDTAISIVSDKIQSDSMNSKETAKSLLDMIATSAYSGKADAQSILDKCEKNLNNSQDRNKIAVVFVKKISDENILKSKIEELENKGILVYIMALGGYSGTITQIYSSETELDLRLNVSELYGAFSSINQVMSLADNETAASNENAVSKVYTSDFKIGKHNFKTSDGQQCGEAIASVLNIYKFLPAIAKNELDTDRYDLSSSASNLYGLATGNSNIMSGTWDMFEMFNSLSSLYPWEDDKKKIENIIDKNLAYRFPVVVSDDNNFKILIAKNSNGTYDSYTYYDPFEGKESYEEGGVKADNILKVMDTYQYLLDISKNSKNITNKTSENEAFYSKVSFKWPENCNAAVKKFTVDEQGDINGFADDGVNISEETFLENNKNVRYACFDTSQAENDTLYTSYLNATFNNDAIPDIYNSVHFYKVIKYTETEADIRDTWYYNYLFKATNLGIINGDQQEDGSLPFNAENNVTRAQYLKMIIEASGYDLTDDKYKEYDSLDDLYGDNTNAINNDIESAKTTYSNAVDIVGVGAIEDISGLSGLIRYKNADDSNKKHWANRYMNFALYHNMINAAQYMGLDYGKPDELTEAYGGCNIEINRLEAANIATTMFVDNVTELLVPTNIQEYNQDISCEKNTLWKSDTKPFYDFDKCKNENGIYQMYLNGVMFGNDRGYFEPYDNLKRAQACKVITKCLFDLDENLEQIHLEFEGYDNILPFDTDISKPKDGWNDEYNIFAARSGYYFIKVSGSDLAHENYTLKQRVANDNDTYTYVNLDDDYTKIYGDEELPDYVISQMYGDGCVYKRYYLDKNTSLKLSGLGNNVSSITIQPPRNGDIAFKEKGGGKYIFSNSPETITEDYIADGNGKRNWIMRNSSLEKGDYSMSLYHHTRINYEITIDAEFYAETDTQITFNRFGLGKPLGEWASLNIYNDYLRRSSTEDVIPYNENISLNVPYTITIPAETRVWLSDIYMYIYGSDYLTIGGDYGETPIFGIMDFTIDNGIADINIMAYKDGYNSSNFNWNGDASYVFENHHKGIADSLPEVSAEVWFDISDNMPDSTYLNGTVFNEKYPFGKDLSTCYGDMRYTWATHINPQSDPTIMGYGNSAEHDMLALKYKDITKLDFYGSDVSETEKDDIWRFDTVHTQIRTNNLTAYENSAGFMLLKENEGEVDPKFKPSDYISSTDLNMFEDSIKNDYSYLLAASLANYGVVEKYTINITNNGNEPRELYYQINAIANIVLQTNGTYDVKNIDKDNNNIQKRSTKEYLLGTIEPNTTSTFELTVTLPTADQGGVLNSLFIKNINQ